MVKIFSGDDTDFKGDQRLALTFAAPDVDFDGCTAEVEFLGQRRTFAQVTNGGRLVFSFTADETRGMRCGVWPVIIRLRDSAGRVRTVNNTNRIKVTNDVNEAYADQEQELAVALTSGGVALPEIPAELDAEAGDSVGDFKRKYNSLLELLRNVAAIAVAVLLPFAASAATPLDDIPGTNEIYTAAETDARIIELAPRTDLTPATNYTDQAINDLATSLAPTITAIVTNTVEESQWIYYDLPDGATVISPPHEGDAGSEMVIAIGGTEYTGYNCDQVEDIEYYGFYDMPGAPIVGAAHRPVTRNALGLARLSDLPTNHVTQAELDAAIDAIPVPEIDTSTLATKQQLQAVSNEAQVVYRLFSGSNVVAEVTNYNSQVNAPQLRLLQLNESNEYFTVWAETNGLTRTLNSANAHTDSATNDLAASCALTYAPRAWSRTTSGLGAEAPSNTTWISTPTTVIAGGLEYAKVVHANGAVWVLSGNGMMNFDPTTNAYLRISADDGTEIFSIEKTDAVTVGAYAEGITVSGNVVTIPVPVVSVDHPTMYWRESLEGGGWADESEINGRLGGGYEWAGSSGAWVCTVWVTDGLPPSMFFKFTYEQPGSTVIKNGAAVDVSGGIMCTDGIHKCRPVYNNGSITWEVVP